MTRVGHEGRRGDRERHADAPDRTRAAAGRAAQLRCPQAAAGVRRRGERSAPRDLPAAHRPDGAPRTWPRRSRASARKSSRSWWISTCRAERPRSSGTSPDRPRPWSATSATAADPGVGRRGGGRRRLRAEEQDRDRARDGVWRQGDQRRARRSCATSRRK